MPEGCFAGDEILLWVSDELRLERESAQIVCQELIDRYIHALQAMESETVKKNDTASAHHGV